MSRSGASAVRTSRSRPPTTSKTPSRPLRTIPTKSLVEHVVAFEPAHVQLTRRHHAVGAKLRRHWQDHSGVSHCCGPHSLTRNLPLGYSGKRWGSRLPVGWPWTWDVALPHSVAGELSVHKGRVASPSCRRHDLSSSGPSRSHSISNPVSRFHEVSYR